MSRGVGTGGRMVGNPNGYSTDLYNQAFVLVNSQIGHENEVLHSLKKSGYEATGVLGIYDTMIKVKAETPEKLKESILKIREIKYVKSALDLKIATVSSNGGELVDVRYTPKKQV